MRGKGVPPHGLIHFSKTQYLIKHKSRAAPTMAMKALCSPELVPYLYIITLLLFIIIIQINTSCSIIRSNHLCLYLIGEGVKLNADRCENDVLIVINLISKIHSINNMTWHVWQLILRKENKTKRFLYFTQKEIAKKVL